MKRQRIKRYDTSELMGEGAWVDVALLTVGQRRVELDLVKATVADADLTTIDSRIFNYDLVSKRLEDNVVAWNWLDDEDNEMSQPKENPEVLATLTFAERNFLNDCICGVTDEALKNS